MHIVHEIRRLLALSISPNQHETEAALAKSLELALKHKVAWLGGPKGRCTPTNCLTGCESGGRTTPVLFRPVRLGGAVQMLHIRWRIRVGESVVERIDALGPQPRRVRLSLPDGRRVDVAAAPPRSRTDPQPEAIVVHTWALLGLRSARRHQEFFGDTLDVLKDLGCEGVSSRPLQRAVSGRRFVWRVRFDYYLNESS